MTLEQEITRIFSDAGQSIDDRIFAECRCLQSQCSCVTNNTNNRDHADKSICQVYDLEPTDLFWKLEALNYNQPATRSGISHITMDTLSAVKTKIQQDLAKGNRNNKQTHSKSTTAQVNRLKLPAHMARSIAQASVPTAVQMKQEQLGNGISITSNISTTATVTFHGPKLDQESKKKRACELEPSILIPIPTWLVDRYMYEKIFERSEGMLLLCVIRDADITSIS